MLLLEYTLNCWVSVSHILKVYMESTKICRLICDSKLHVGVNVSVNGYVSDSDL